MQSPALTEKEYRLKLDAIEKCGANRGPHDYIPISWAITKTAKHVSQLMCRVCFRRIHIETLMNNYPEVKA